MSETKQRVVSGTLWTTAAGFSTQLLLFTVTAILAHLLNPRSFGLVGMILIFTGFAALFVDMGFSAAVIQRKEVEERHLSSVFAVNVCAGLVLAGLMVALAPALSALYGEPRLVALTMVVSINFVVSSLVGVQIALLNRAMNFRRLALIDMIGTALSGVAAVTAALLGAGVWSLIVQAIVLSSTRAALLWWSSDWRPRARPDLAAIRELWGFSSNLVGFNVLNYWTRNADNFLVGKFVGPVGLGIYGRSYNVMLMPLSQISWTLSRVMFPTLSRMQGDNVRVKRAYLRSIGVLALLTFPLMAGLFVVAEPFVLTLFGPRWQAMVPIVQILCVAGLTQSIGTSVGWLYQSQGRTDWQFRWGLFSSAVTFAAFGIGILWGVKGIAIAFVVRTLLLLYPNYSIPGRLIGMRFREVAGTVSGVLVASVAMAGGVWLLGRVLPGGLGPTATLAIEVVAGVILYAALVLGLRLEPARELRVIIRDLLARRSSTDSLPPGVQPVGSK